MDFASAILAMQEEVVIAYVLEEGRAVRVESAIATRLADGGVIYVKCQVAQELEKIALDMVIVMQQQRPVHALKDGPGSVVKLQIVLARLTVSEGAFAMAHLMFQSVRTVSVAGWVQIVISRAYTVFKHR